MLARSPRPRVFKVAAHGQAWPPGGGRGEVQRQLPATCPHEQPPCQPALRLCTATRLLQSGPPWVSRWQGPPAASGLCVGAAGPPPCAAAHMTCCRRICPRAWAGRWAAPGRASLRSPAQAAARLGLRRITGACRPEGRQQGVHLDAVPQAAPQTGAEGSGWPREAWQSSPNSRRMATRMCLPFAERFSRGSAALSSCFSCSRSAPQL